MKTFLQVFIVLFIALVGIGFLLAMFIGETAFTVMGVLMIALVAGIIAMLIKQDEKTEALEVRIKALEIACGADAGEKTAETKEENKE